jgi:hypothetical protein
LGQQDSPEITIMAVGMAGMATMDIMAGVAVTEADIVVEEKNLRVPLMQSMTWVVALKDSNSKGCDEILWQVKNQLGHEGN